MVPRFNVKLIDPGTEILRPFLHKLGLCLIFISTQATVVWDSENVADFQKACGLRKDGEVD